jgi:hypothetical protein
MYGSAILIWIDVQQYALKCAEKMQGKPNRDIPRQNKPVFLQNTKAEIKSALIPNVRFKSILKYAE